MKTTFGKELFRKETKRMESLSISMQEIANTLKRVRMQDTYNSEYYDRLLVDFVNHEQAHQEALEKIQTMMRIEMFLEVK